MKFETAGTWWNNKDIEMVKLEDGRVFALHGWNGEGYLDSWECFGEYLSDASDKKYRLYPISEGIGEANEDGEFDQYEIIEYELGIG